MKTLKYIGLLLIILGISVSCTRSKKEVCSIPKMYIIKVKYTDNTIDTIHYYSTKSKGEITFTIQTISYGWFSDTPIPATLQANDWYSSESITQNVRNFTVLEKVY